MASIPELGCERLWSQQKEHEAICHPQILAIDTDEVVLRRITPHVRKCIVVSTLQRQLIVAELELHVLLAVGASLWNQCQANGFMGLEWFILEFRHF